MSASRLDDAQAAGATLINPLAFHKIPHAECSAARADSWPPPVCAPHCSAQGGAKEESAFTSRMRSQGVVCRLVKYCRGEDPARDIHIHGGLGHPIVVDAVFSGGKAARSGVQRGDRLLSIDDRKDFTHMSGRSVQASLRPPTTLIFMGFEGRMHSEVRLLPRGPARASSGKPARAGHSDVFQLSDETVFEPGRASIFFATSGNAEDQELAPRSRPLYGAPQSGVAALFELCHDDARLLLQNARLSGPEPWLSRSSKGEARTVVTGAALADGELTLAADQQTLLNKDGLSPMRPGATHADGKLPSSDAAAPVGHSPGAPPPRSRGDSNANPEPMSPEFRNPGIQELTPDGLALSQVVSI